MTDLKKLMFIGFNMFPISTAGTEISIFEIAKRLNKKYSLALSLTNIGINEEKIPELSDFHIYPVKKIEHFKNFFPIKMINYIIKARKTWKNLNKFKPDIVLTFSITPLSYISLLYARSRKIPLIVRSEGSDLNIKENFIFQYMKKKVCHLADQIICTSEPHIDIVNSFKPKNKPILIGNGSSYERIQYNTIQKKKNDLFKLIFVGTLRKVKNIPVIIEAVKNIFDTEKDYKEKISVDIIGDGPLKQELMNLIEKYQLSDTISLLGKLDRNQLREKYQNADIFILPSISESAPLVLIEAISFALPLICSEIPNLTYFYKPNINAIYFSHDKPEELGKKIIELIDNEKLRLELRENNWKLAALFSWDKIVDKINEIIEKCNKKNFEI